MLLRHPALVLTVCVLLGLGTGSQSSSTSTTKSYPKGDNKTSTRDNYVTKKSKSVSDMTKGSDTDTPTPSVTVERSTSNTRSVGETVEESGLVTFSVQDTDSGTDRQETEEMTTESDAVTGTLPETSTPSTWRVLTSRTSHQPPIAVTHFTKTPPNKSVSRRTKTLTATPMPHPHPSAFTSTSASSSLATTSQISSTTSALAKADEIFIKTSKIDTVPSSERPSVMTTLHSSSMTSFGLEAQVPVQDSDSARPRAALPVGVGGRQKREGGEGLEGTVSEAPRKRPRQTEQDVYPLALRAVLDDSLGDDKKSKDTTSTKNNNRNNVMSKNQGLRGPPGPKGDPGPPGNCSCEGEALGPNPSFQAAVSAVLTRHFGPDKDVIVPFDLELIDLADDYDNQSGVFFCSIPGTYVISVYLMSHPGFKVNARVLVNSRPVAALWADDSKNAGFYPSSSIQTISRLEFGDQVYVMLVDGGYGESWVHANYNVFTVFLLYEDFFGR